MVAALDMIACDCASLDLSSSLLSQVSSSLWGVSCLPSSRDRTGQSGVPRLVKTRDPVLLVSDKVRPPTRQDRLKEQVGNKEVRERKREGNGSNPTLFLTFRFTNLSGF